MKAFPPLRFLGLVLGGWVCLRAAMLVPDWVTKVEPAIDPRTPTSPTPPTAVRPERSRGTLVPPVRLSAVSAPLDSVSQIRATRTGGKGAAFSEAKIAVAEPAPSISRNTIAGAARMPEPAAVSLQDLPVAARPVSRWSGSAWTFLRRGSHPLLGAAGMMLGASQVGGRIGYRINSDAERPLSIVGRASAPVHRLKGREVALGVEWKPDAQLPVRMLAERRQAIGSESRSAFALMVHGGVSKAPLAAGFSLEAYAQAGMVGARSRDLFADAYVAVAAPLAEDRRLTLGAAVWGATQPGISRFDAGPRISLRLPGAERVRLVADWRFRLHGHAAPASGPSLTLATDF